MRRIYFGLIALIPFAIADAQVPCPNCRPMITTTPTAAAPVLYLPQTVYQPYQLQQQTYQPRYYPTPVRRWFFGSGTVTSYYVPMVPQQQQQQGQP